MKAKDYRQSAWNSLSGKWGVCVLAFLIFELITAACAGSNANRFSGVVISVAGIIIFGPLTLGLSMIGLNVARGKNVEVGMLFKGFSDFGRSFVLYITNYIFIALWSILFIIPGIIKSLAYSMSYYILIDNPNISANDARKKSIAMMKGNKWRLFCLYFSFIGWFLLCIITLGILSFWVSPYVEVARAKFYLSLLPEEQSDDNADDNGSVDIDGDLNSYNDANSARNDSDAFAKDNKDDFDFFGSDDEFK